MEEFCSKILLNVPFKIVYPFTVELFQIWKKNEMKDCYEMDIECTKIQFNSIGNKALDRGS